MYLLKNGVSFLRSYKIRCIVIVQYLGQLISAYGKVDASGFLNSKARLFYALNDLDDAKFFSACVGEKTVRVSSRSINSGYGDNNGANSENINYQSQKLMTPDEIMRLHKNKEIILIESSFPVKANKCYWFKEKKYKRFDKYTKTF